MVCSEIRMYIVILFLCPQSGGEEKGEYVPPGLPRLVTEPRADQPSTVLITASAYVTW